MGINGLLKSLESIKSQKHISDYKGKRIAIDGYCWLHKSIYSIRNDIIANPDSEKYLNYLIKRLEILVYNKIIPVFIFDGDKLPAKKNTEEEREKKRSDTRKLGKDYLKQGDYEKAKSKFVESYDVNPRMAYNFIKVLKSKNIEYFVAPYEADAQLAYLEKINYVDMVMTEDSDLLAYGCKTVLFKFESEGFLDEINLKNLANCRDLNFKGFSQDSFLIFCILCGCDYFKLDRCGAKKAYQIASERRDYKEIINYLKISNLNISDKIEKDFERAFLTFKFQVVFCPKEKKYRYFSDIEDTRYEAIHKYKDLTFLGKILDEQTAKDIAYGLIDPITLERFEESNNSIVKRLFEGKNKALNASNNIITANNTANNSDKNILDKYIKKSNPDISNTITNNSKTHYLENHVIYEKKNKINNNFDYDNNENYYSNNFKSEKEKSFDNQNKEEEEENINILNNESSNKNSINEKSAYFNSKSQLAGKNGLFNKLVTNSVNDNPKNKLIKVNKNNSFNNLSQNNAMKNFSFLKNDHADKKNNNKIYYNVNYNSNNYNTNASLSTQCNNQSSKESEQFKEKSSEDFHIDLTSKIYDNENYENIKREKNIEKNSLSALSASDEFNSGNIKSKSKDNTSSNIDLDVLQNYYFDLSDDLEVPFLNKPNRKNQILKNNDLTENIKSNKDSNKIYSGKNLKDLNEEFNININDKVNQLNKNNSNVNNKKIPNYKNQNINNIKLINEKEKLKLEGNHSSYFNSTEHLNHNENIFDGYFYNENQNFKIKNCSETNKINKLTQLDFQTKRKTNQLDSNYINHQHQNKAEFSKNNENTLNNNYSEPLLINPLNKKDNINTFNNKLINQQSNYERQLFTKQIKNPNNFDYNINREEANETSIKNFSFNIQNNLNINNEKVYLSNNNLSLENNRFNISNSLASKLSTETFKVLENFDDYLNQYDDINKLSNNSNKFSDNLMFVQQNKNFDYLNSNQNIIFDNFNYLQQNEFEKSKSKNFCVLDQVKKKELISLNDSNKKLINLNYNKEKIIDLTIDNNEEDVNLSNDNLDEILINCKDEQIQTKLLINKSLNKKPKQNSFI